MDKIIERYPGDKPGFFSQNEMLPVLVGALLAWLVDRFVTGVPLQKMLVAAIGVLVLAAYALLRRRFAQKLSVATYAVMVVVFVISYWMVK